tara:strand:- start:1789 stop:1920 length:132 start_codon:yes stop_codon:yes gene_type:complete
MLANIDFTAAAFGNEMVHHTPFRARGENVDRETIFFTLLGLLV